MASRRRARHFALQVLYQVDLSPVELTDALDGLWGGLLDEDGIDDQRPHEPEEAAFATELTRGVLEHIEELDALIDACSTNWRVSRMPIVDRTIIRIAAYELKLREDIPPAVTINEAVEMAKAFGSEESRAFVNGIVDRIGRQLGVVDGSKSRQKRTRKGS